MVRKVRNDDNIKEVTIEISSWCPLNCRHCSTWFSGHYYSLEDYAIDIDSVIDKAIEYIKSENTSIRVRFSGGEPLPFLNRTMFDKIKIECPNIVEWVVTTSGSIPIIVLEDFIKQMEGFEYKIVYRISLYGNKKRHTEITRNYICYNSIKTIEWLISHGYDVELTTPIFNFWNVFNVVIKARKYKIPVRFTKLISTPAIKAPSQRYQLLVARIMKILYRKVYLTCSLYGQCKKICEYPKSTILATTKVIGCAIDKLSNIDIDKNKGDGMSYGCL